MENRNAESEWSDLDQIAFRKNLQDIMCFNLPGHDVDEQRAALAKLKDIVMEELAINFHDGFMLGLRSDRQESLKEARVLADWAAESLKSVGLAFKHPESGEPARLIVANTPPKEGEGWFMLEPILDQTTSRSVRLPKLISNLKLCPAPVMYDEHSKGSPAR
jgi:hypothetical protein